MSLLDQQLPLKFVPRQPIIVHRTRRFGSTLTCAWTMADLGAWNVRYVAYAAVHGNTPNEQLAADRVKWPGGVMAGFSIWIQERWAEWRQANAVRRDDWVSPEMHTAFDEWLATLGPGDVR